MCRVRRRLACIGLALALAVPGAATAGTVKPSQTLVPIESAQGITVSCWRWGYEWADPEMHALMATLPEVGANWVAIHPYAHVSRETGNVRWSAGERTDHVTNPTRWAHQLGLRIMVKPHLSYWGEFSWRGEIGWGEDEAKWNRFRTSYREWIAHMAEVAEREGADLFVVGTELRQIESNKRFWGEVIDAVRERYSGPLTYAANWDDFEQVPFWDRLDYVGVQAYFPISQAEGPGVEELRKGWTRPLQAMRTLSHRVGRPVLVTEVGYTNSSRTAARPWESSRGAGPTDVQERSLRTALEVFDEAPFVAGAFIWKWFPTTRSIGPGDFTVQTDSFKELLASTWKRQQLASCAPSQVAR